MFSCRWCVMGQKVRVIDITAYKRRSVPDTGVSLTGLYFCGHRHITILTNHPEDPEMLFLGVFLLFLVATDACMFPKACITPGNNTFPKDCCPLYNGTPCGSGANRGSCMPVSRSRSMSPPDVTQDDRDMFPVFYFRTMCQCKDNFQGVNCGECANNRYGANCEFARNLVRVELRQKSETEQQLFLAQLDFCKYEMDPDYYILKAGDRFRRQTFVFSEASYYDTWCYSHYYATKPFINNTVEIYIINYAHGSTGFLSWHRKSLFFLESQMQKCTKDPTFTLPYYDWRSEGNCSMCSNELLGASDDQGYLQRQSIFSDWRMTCSSYRYDATYCLMPDCICERPKITRRPGAIPYVGIPTKEDVQYCLTLPDVDTDPYTSRSSRSARNCIEGFTNQYNRPATSTHNLFHVFCGGTMSQVPISCNDPMFVLHHSFVDKMFDRYIVKWGITKSSYPDNHVYGHGPYDCITPFCQCTRHRDMFVPSSTFGVTYSNYKSF